MLAAACFSAAAFAQVSSVVNLDEFVHDWKVSKQFTLDVAKAMPAEDYSFKPNPEEMSFGEQMLHIAVSNAFRFNQITGIKPPFVSFPTMPPSDRATVLKLLEQSFDYVLDVLPKITDKELERTWNIPSWKGRPKPNGRDMILNMFVHTAHHRAQCEVYLRIKNIQPPDYSF